MPRRRAQREAAEGLRQRIAQTSQDAEREQALDRDAETALSGLGAEASDIQAASERAGEELTVVEARFAELSDTLAECERMLERLTAELAEWNAAKASHERAREVASALVETSGQQLGEAEARLEQAMSGAMDAPDVQLAQSATEQARALAISARHTLTEARLVLDGAERAEREARAPLEAAEREVQTLAAEARALADVLRPEGQDLWPPLVDAVAVQPGYEAALAAALGDDLQAPLDEAAPHHWRDLGTFDAVAPLPDGVKPLKDFVLAPDALDRRLTMTGVVFPDQGAAIQKLLKAGQRLVSPRGDLWRWDGFSASADAPSQAAARLTQRNRLAALEADIIRAKEDRAAAFEIYSAAKTDAENARAAATLAEQEDRRTEKGLIEAQDDAARTARAAAERASRLATLESEIRRLTASRDAAAESERQAAEALAELGDGIALSQSVTETASARPRSAPQTAKCALPSTD